MPWNGGNVPRDGYGCTAEKETLAYNHWLIIPSTQDVGPPQSKRARRLSITLRTWLFAAALSILIVAAAVPVGAAAGTFALVSSLFSGGHASPTSPIAQETHNSQTLPLLRAAAHVDPNPAKGGGDITVAGDALLPDAGPAGTLANIEEHPPASDQINIYVVREGDTLSQIAEMFSVSVNTVRWANDIARGEAIQPGQTLVILPVSGVRHTVEKGDTLRGIAKQYDTDLGEILSFNNLSEDAVLAVGEVVVVPDAEIGEPTPTVSAPVRTTSSGSSSGSVSSGFFIHPLPGAVRTQGIHGYNAVDLGAPAGAQILAAAAGEVLISRSGGWNGGYGAYVVLKHDNGTQTVYAHNSTNIVYAGQRVVQGQVIGYVGASGRTTGPHLHFEVRGSSNPF